MGLFKKKVSVCDACGKSEAEGCGATINHVEKITKHGPDWFPESLRSRALGEFTWRCPRCDSYPALKWPGVSGAYAGLMFHLGQEHRVGELRDSFGDPRVEVIPIRAPGGA